MIMMCLPRMLEILAIAKNSKLRWLQRDINIQNFFSESLSLSLSSSLSSQLFGFFNMATDSPAD